MKKTAAALAAAVIAALSILPAGAETTAQQDQPAIVEEKQAGAFEEFGGIVFDFSSGVGGWCTELVINADGTFSGNFHDSEMGEMADEYPNGSFYMCSFTGRFEMGEDGTLTVTELTADEPASEQIQDGLRCVSVSEPYGLTLGARFTVHRPGDDAQALTEAERFWFHMTEDGMPENFYGLYDAENDCGFRGDLPIGE